MSLLLDTYGELLTDKQSTFLRRYYEEDLSFGEIAEEFDVSRQAIFDAVKHGETQLERYEKVLGLVGAGLERTGAVQSSGPSGPAALAASFSELAEAIRGCADEISSGKAGATTAGTLGVVAADLEKFAERFAQDGARAGLRAAAAKWDAEDADEEVEAGHGAANGKGSLLGRSPEVD